MFAVFGIFEYWNLTQLRNINLYSEIFVVNNCMLLKFLIFLVFCLFPIHPVLMCIPLINLVHLCIPFGIFCALMFTPSCNLVCVFFLFDTLVSFFREPCYVKQVVESDEFLGCCLRVGSRRCCCGQTSRGNVGSPAWPGLSSHSQSGCQHRYELCSLWLVEWCF